MRIAIVDDEEIVRETLGEYLFEFGHTVHTAVDGKAALKMFNADQYDLALVDVRMPGMDGFSLLADCRNRFPEMTVVIMTGHGDQQTSDEAERLGANEFLIKPIRLAELDEVLTRSAQTP